MIPLSTSGWSVSFTSTYKYILVSTEFISAIAVVFPKTYFALGKILNQYLQFNGE